MKERIEQHRAVPGREHEPVTVRPERLGGVELQMVGEKDRSDIRHAQGQAGMARGGGLDRVHRKGADRVRQIVVADGALGQVGPLLAERRIGGASRPFGTGARLAGAREKSTRISRSTSR
jgi:hypothetical protein